jgi:hypothetical protein
MRLFVTCDAALTDATSLTFSSISRIFVECLERFRNRSFQSHILLSHKRIL